MSSRQTESPPPESSTSSGSPPRTRPASRAASSGRSTSVPLAPGAEQAARLVEALQLHLADLVELQVAGVAHRVDDRVGDQDLPAARPRDHPGAEAHLAGEVVAVAVERGAVVDADARLGPLVVERLQADRPVGE